MEERREDWVTVAVDMPPSLRDAITKAAKSTPGSLSRQAYIRQELAKLVGWEP